MPFQYIRENGVDKSNQREVFSAHFATHPVSLGLKVDLLALGETRKASPFDRADVNEHIRRSAG